MTDQTVPPGAPGISPRWTSSAKSAIGTAAGAESRVWFTISHGILNEVYAPRLDTACIRDFGLLVTAKDYFSEEKRDADHTVVLIEDGVPAFRLVNTSRDGRYRITKWVLSDPDREVVLQELHFEALVGKLSDYQVHALISPHLVNAGAGNTAWVGDFKGRPMLFAEARGTSLAIASSVPWNARSVGYVGTSDGWQTLIRGEGLKPEYQYAQNGNVALAGTLDLANSDGRAVLTMGFGAQPEEAAFRAVLSLQQGVASALKKYSSGWRNLQSMFLPLDEPRDPRQLNRYRISTAVLESHRDDASGAIIASLSIPWGFRKVLTGERAHYEITAGRLNEARRLLATFEASGSVGGLLPEQIWDSADIPERELFLGRPSGSAMPLVWAHAEHIKLLRSLRDGVVFDMPPQPYARYVKSTPKLAPIVWRKTSKISRISVGRTLRPKFLEPASVHWSSDNWAITTDCECHATGLGTFIYDLPTKSLAAGSEVRFTILWTQQGKWEGTNFTVAIGE